MTAPTGRTRAQENKRLHVVMRDGTLVEGSIHIGEDMSLVAFLGSRKGGWMNMVDARRAKLDEAPGHLVIQTDLVVLISAPDENVVIVGQAGAGAGERAVELHLIGGKMIRGTMFLAPMQRLSDYLHHGGKFAGVARATLNPDGREIGDVAVNTAAISMIRESKAEDE
ncbi:MAG: hypothetical protein JNL44_09250 [Gemmatimonadetes bacterium]|nr:hypothetical protein [Gemmatimonadota bacterium]